MKNNTPSIMGTLAALNYIYIPFLAALFYIVYNHNNTTSTHLVMGFLLIHSAFMFLTTRYTILALKSIEARIKK